MMSLGRGVLLVVGSFVMLAPQALSPERASAQNPEGGDVQLSAQTSLQARPAARSDSSGVRIGVQARIDAFNVLGVTATLPGSGYGTPLTPIVTPGVRFLDQRLYLGLGLGLFGSSSDNGNAETSRSGLSFSPMAMFDVLNDGSTALSLGGWLNLTTLGETEVCDNDGDCVSGNDDAFGWGLNLMAGLRSMVTPGLAIGAEFGWGFLSASSDEDDGDDFYHGLLGVLLFEASLGV